MGLTYCEGYYYITDERVREILRIDPKGNASVLPIDFEGYVKKVKYSPFSGIKNAGFEGLTCDCQNNKLYVANERDYRMIFTVDMRTNKVIDHFDIPAGYTVPYYKGDWAITPDFSDGTLRISSTEAYTCWGRSILDCRHAKARLLNGEAHTLGMADSTLSTPTTLGIVLFNPAPVKPGRSSTLVSLRTNTP